MKAALNIFQKTNSLLAEYDDNFGDIYMELRSHFLTLFDSISNNSDVFKHKKHEKTYLERERLMAKENELLKARLGHLNSSESLDKSAKRFKNTSKSPEHETNRSKRLKETGEKIKNNDTQSHATFGVIKQFLKEDNFLKNFSRVEAGFLLKDVMYRPMSEQVLSEFIKEIFGLKKAHDLKNLESEFPRETLEQFLYGYLKKKYGLQQVIIEKILSITMGIQDHSQINNDIALFGLVSLLGHEK